MAEFSEPVRPPPSITPAQWWIVALLAAIVLLVGTATFFPPAASAQSESTGTTQSSGGMLAVAGQITRDSYGLYLVDLRNDTICVYEYVGGRPGSLHLRAARTFAYDCRLDSYNTEPPPEKIAEMVSKASRLKDVKAPPP